MPRRKSVADATEGDGKRYALNMRTTREVREALERAAAASGRSLVQEVEFRLEKSFLEERFSQEAKELGNLVMMSVDVIQHETEKKWNSGILVSRYFYNRVVHILKRVMINAEIESLEDSETKAAFARIDEKSRDDNRADDDRIERLRDKSFFERLAELAKPASGKP